MTGAVTWWARSHQLGCGTKTLTANTSSIRPSNPATFSMIENFTRQTTIHTANAATGIHIIGPTSVASCSANATLTADFGGERHQVDEERRGQVRGRGPGSESLADDLEGSPPAHRRHPTCHVRVQTGADHADDDHPHERQTEARTDDGIGHQVSDVDESADGGENSQRYRENF